MTPERAAAVVSRWVRLYTRKLPDQVAQRRAGEVKADVHDHITHERAAATSERRIALGVLSRMIRGAVADASWRSGLTERGPGFRAACRSALGTALILMLPLVAMQVSGDVVWTVFDFAAAAILLGGAGFVLQLAMARGQNRPYRAAAALAVATTFMLIWAIGAVGVIGVDGDSADLMYGVVLAVGFAGTILGRVRPAAMARTLLAMAGAQTVVTAVALLAGKHESANSSALEIIGVNAFFVALFLVSAALFRFAAERRAIAG